MRPPASTASADRRAGRDERVNECERDLTELPMRAAWSRRQPGTHAAAIVLYYLLPMVWGVLAAFSGFRTAGEWLNPSTTFGYVQAGQWDGHLPEIGVSFALWVLLPLVAGVVRTLRREVG
jgi:polyferredoxin